MKHRLLLHFSYVTAAKYFAELLFVIRGMVIAHVLGPAAFGVWSAMRLVLVFSRFTHAGSSNGMLQNAPDAEGAGDLPRADADRQVASAVSLLGAVAGAIMVGLIFGGWGLTGDPKRWWWLLAAIIIAQQLMLFYQDALASQRRFEWSALAMSSFAALSTITCIFGAIAFGLDGFLIALACSYIVVVTVCSLAGPTFPAPQWRIRHAADLVNTGWPIAAGHILLILLWNVDKLALWICRDNQELGIYAIQAYFTAAIMLLPAAVASVFLPHLRLKLAATRDPRTAQPFLLTGTQVLGHVALPAIGVGFLLLHLPIRWLLPAYADAIAPGRVLMLVCFVSIVASPATTTLTALSHQRRLMVLRAICVVISFIAAVAVLQAGGGLVALAVAVSSGFVLHAFVAMYLALRQANVPKSEWLSHLAVVLGPYTLMVALLLVLFMVIPDKPNSLTGDVTLSTLRCVIVLMCSLPLVWRVWRKLDLPPVGYRSMTA